MFFGIPIPVGIVVLLVGIALGNGILGTRGWSRSEKRPMLAVCLALIGGGLWLLLTQPSWTF